MISLNDVLLAMSNIPVDDPIAEIWGRQLQGGYKIIEYTGALPITINANGNTLLDYRIYGSDGGVGEPTKSGEPTGYKLPMTVMNNLAPPLAQWGDGYVSTTGAIWQASTTNKEKSSDFIEAKPNTQYVFGIEGDAFPQGTNGEWVGVGLYRNDRTFIRRTSTDRDSPFTFLTSSETKYIRLSYRTYGELWEPRLSENSFSISVYIGENKLDSIEGVSDYVDKSSGKIVRMIGEYTFTGDESFNKYGNSDAFYTSKTIDPVGITTVNTTTMRCDHPAFTAIENKDTRYWLNPEADDICCFLPGGRSQVFFRSTSNFATATECKAYLKAQFDNGTPVKISYWLKTPVAEDPPVPLPEIPTIDGETVIDYDGTPKPSQMYVKYKDKG